MRTPRYRLDGGKSCIDVKVRATHQLFDGRDPAPFRERDLDEDAAEYILGAMQDLPRSAEIKIVFWITEPAPTIPDEAIVDAVRSHFAYEVDRLNRRIREHIRRGQLALLLGVAILIVFLTMAELTLLLSAGHVRQILREGLVIIGWVALWRPLDVLLYEWWPLLRQRRRCTRAQSAEIRIEHTAADEHVIGVVAPVGNGEGTALLSPARVA